MNVPPPERIREPYCPSCGHHYADAFRGDLCPMCERSYLLPMHGEKDNNPTEWAYEQACKARDLHFRRAERLKEALKQVYWQVEGDSDWTLERCQEALKQGAGEARDALVADDSLLSRSRG